MYTHRYVINKVKLLGEVIDAPERLLDGFKKRNQYAQPYIECKPPFYYLVTIENGKELERQKFLDADMLLYSVFEKITFEMALEYEVIHRIPTQDSRRLLFSHQLELMEKLSPKWKKRLQNKIFEIVKRNPYQDDL